MSIGTHVFGGKEVHIGVQALSDDHKECECCQIFTHGPRNKNSNMKPKTIAALTESVANGMRIYVHSSYPTALVGGSAHIDAQLEMAKTIGAKGLVIHIPKKLPAELIDGIVRSTMNAGGVKILLEMKAVKPDDKSYESAAKIKVLIELMKGAGLVPEKVGICIDTAHIYAGKMDIVSAASASAYLKDFEGDEWEPWIALLHLNGNQYDSQLRAGDKHAIPFSDVDKIWNGVPFEDSGLLKFARWFVERKKDVILELKPVLGNVDAFLSRILTAV